MKKGALTPQAVTLLLQDESLQFSRPSDAELRLWVDGKLSDKQRAQEIKACVAADADIASQVAHIVKHRSVRAHQSSQARSNGLAWIRGLFSPAILGGALAACFGLLCVKIFILPAPEVQNGSNPSSFGIKSIAPAKPSDKCDKTEETEPSQDQVHCEDNKDVINHAAP